MALDLDDLQLARQTFSNLSDYVKALESELIKTRVSRELREKLILEWWRVTLTAANTPDFGSIMGKILKPDQD